MKTVRDAIRPLEAEPPPTPEIPTQADLAPWRDRIDVLDRLVLQCLNERSRCANVIGQIKKKLDMPVYVPSREEDVLRNVAAANHGPLPDAAVRRIFERIIDETRSLEREKYQDEAESNEGG